MAKKPPSKELDRLIEGKFRDYESRLLSKYKGPLDEHQAIALALIRLTRLLAPIAPEPVTSDEAVSP